MSVEDWKHGMEVRVVDWGQGYPRHQAAYAEIIGGPSPGHEILGKRHDDIKERYSTSDFTVRCAVLNPAGGGETIVGVHAPDGTLVMVGEEGLERVPDEEIPPFRRALRELSGYIDEYLDNGVWDSDGDVHHEDYSHYVNCSKEPGDPWYEQAAVRVLAAAFYYSERKPTERPVGEKANLRDYLF